MISLSFPSMRIHVRALLSAAALAAAGTLAQATPEGWITSHGISTFPGELKYPADFPHLDYVNPDAPKGGEMSIWAFDLLHSTPRFARIRNVCAGSLRRCQVLGVR